jgi:hypothetical protein
MTKQVKISRPNAHNNNLSSQCVSLEAILIRRMTVYGISTTGALLNLMRSFCRACVIAARVYDFEKGQDDSGGKLARGVSDADFDHNEVRMPLSLEKVAPVPRAVSGLDTFFAVRSWAGCITSMSVSNLR